MSRERALRIAVDARELEGRPTGVGRVVAGLLSEWPDRGDTIELIVRTAVQPAWLREDWRVRLAPGPAGLPGALWEQFVLPRELGQADLLLAPGYGMPRFAGLPTAVCMHDCAPFALPHTFGPRERLRRRWSARIAARHAALVFAGSRFAADECHRWLSVPADRFLVIPWGCKPAFRRPDEAEIETVRRRYELTPRTVLFVGSRLQRRNIDALARSVGELLQGRDDLELCLVGGAPAGAERDGPAHVRRLGYVPDEQLPGLYAAATVVAYPSSYEGFGLPVLEALVCGTPVVASDSSALSEVYAGRATLVAHDDGDAWREALALLLDDPAARRAAVLRGQPWALGQSWAPSAERLRERLLTLRARP